MNVKELIIMARQLGMMRPGILTDSIVRTLFSHVQLNEDSSGNSSSSTNSTAAAADEDEMNFDEFKEVLCAISFILNSNPWTPSHKKLQIFLDNIFTAASEILG